ncbi:MAG TPA: hypothetical protein VJZ75_09220 [Candidatus Bathyarchaeia archaeon]|nr:hypothetical protein [Candidatus Bathyarchaeia archaeon]
MNYERFCDNLLTLDHRILFAGIVDDQHSLMHSSFREDAKLYSDPEIIRHFMTLAPQLTVNGLEKVKPVLGAITSVLVRFDKRVLVFSRLDGFIIIVGLDVDIHTPIPDLVTKLIKTAAARAPDLPLPSQELEVTTRIEESAIISDHIV